SNWKPNYCYNTASSCTKSTTPKVYSTTEGGNVTVRCSLFLHPRNRKFLCREECNKFLFDTNDVTATGDRYKIEYESNTLFNVTITELTKSDSGRYRCGVGRNYAKNTCQEKKMHLYPSSKPYQPPNNHPTTTATTLQPPGNP
uniref:Immunoglobulin domain-containing protein n=1 Tax=Lates calcarifer TaxID=8187 RepID=A0A4W6FGU1_LATCA